MSPTVRHDQAHVDLDSVTPVRIPARARCYVIALVAAALAVVVVLALGGAAPPSAGLMLLLAIPLAVVSAFAVDFWRFIPRRRALDLVLLLAVASAGVAVVPELAPLVAVPGAVITAWLVRVSCAASWRRG
jgi:hypothetical protein